MTKAWTLGSLLRLRCPACGADSFKAGWFHTSKACQACGLVFEPEAGFYAGAIYPFYAAAVLVGGAAIVAGKLGLGLGNAGALGLAAAAVLLASPWLFWYSRMSFLHTVHRFFGEEA